MSLMANVDHVMAIVDHVMVTVDHVMSVEVVLVEDVTSHNYSPRECCSCVDN